MQLLDHVSLSVTDLDVARPFYDAVMSALGAEKVYDRPQALGYGQRCNAKEDQHTCLAVYATATPQTHRPDPKQHVCFKARSRQHVALFYRQGLAHGGQDDGAPGLRSHYHAHYFAAFLIDPSGNRIEAVCHAPCLDDQLA